MGRQLSCDRGPTGRLWGLHPAPIMRAAAELPEHMETHLWKGQMASGGRAY